MKRHYLDDEIGLALNNLDAVLKELNIKEYKNSLYTLYDSAQYVNIGSKRTSYYLLESTIKDTSYKLLDAIKILLDVLFVWEYKLEARFDISINSKLYIIFHEPVVQYEVDVYDCKFR